MPSPLPFQKWELMRVPMEAILEVLCSLLCIWKSQICSKHIRDDAQLCVVGGSDRIRLQAAAAGKTEAWWKFTRCTSESENSAMMPTVEAAQDAAVNQRPTMANILITAPRRMMSRISDHNFWLK